MEGNAYIGELLAGAVYLITGIRLLRLSQRTGEAPERLLGVCFIATAASALSYVLPNLPAFESLWAPLNFAGRIFVIPDVVAFALFTWRVFRPEARWGGWLVWGPAILLVVGIGGSAMAGDWEGFSISSGWFWLEWVGYTLPFGWASSETLAHYSRARRRKQLGLCDPLVCNRYLLWALFGAMQVGLSLILLPQYAEYEATNQFTAAWDGLYGTIEIASLVMIWLVFFPPAYYQRWINGTTPVENAEEV